MKLSRDFGFPVLFPNDFYVLQSEPSKLHRLCAVSHTKLLSSPHGAVRSPKDSEESVLDV